MDWVQFLTDHQIPFVSRGPNTKRGEVSVQCPLCGEDDPSEHLGISLTTENWGCLRNALHRGHSTPKLISLLLSCSYPQAALITRQYSAPDPNSLDSALAALNATSGPAIEPEGPHIAALPHDFDPIQPKGSTARFWRYLQRRGFDDVGRLCQQYRLSCCLTGRWQDRVIIPIHYRGQLLGWTGRAIQKTVSAPRYLTSSTSIKTVVYNEDELAGGGELLFVTEGPFDALKMDFYGRAVGARATCTFGATATIDQIAAIVSLSKHFNSVALLFDRDAVEQAFTMEEWLRAKNISFGQLPEGVKDPGDLSKEEVQVCVDRCKHPL